MARLPDFLIIGAMKSGTTSLAVWLSAREDVFVAPEKEVNFFGTHWERGLDWYRERFAGAGDAAAVGEATPTYMIDEPALDRIQRTLPGVRIIVLAREPVDRAYSQYRHWRRKGEYRSFADAVRGELDAGRPEAVAQWDLGRAGEYRYLAPGRYARILRRLEERFGRERLHVVLMDDLQADPAGTFRGVCRFLGIPEEPVPDVVGSRENAGRQMRWVGLYRLLVRIRFGSWAPRWLGRLVFLALFSGSRDHPEMPPALRAELMESFATDNDELAEWLGRDLPPGWSRARRGA